MAHVKQLSITLAVVVLAILALVMWSRPSAAAGPQVVGGDPLLSDLAFLPAGEVRGSGKYSFFILERENSSHRWFMRLNSETGALEKLTAEKGWAPIGSTREFAH
jgi:hypothetical protein